MIFELFFLLIIAYGLVGILCLNLTIESKGMTEGLAIAIVFLWPVLLILMRTHTRKMLDWYKGENSVGGEA